MCFLSPHRGQKDHSLHWGLTESQKHPQVSKDVDCDHPGGPETCRDS